MTRTMAKSVALVAALTVSLAAVTQADTIGKAIGYTKIELPDAGEYKLLTMSLNSESGASLTLSEIFGDGTLHTHPASSLADVVYLFIDGSYTGYYKKSDVLGFYEVGGSEADPVIRAGQGFWVKGGSGNPGGKSIYVLGQAVESTGLDVGNGFELIGNAVTKPIDIVNDIDWSQVPGVTAHPASSLADKIYVYNNGSYTGYYLRSGYVWYQIGGSAVSSLELDVGEGFWYAAQSSGVDLNL
jgi:hypothetical protein